jgi:hypothetical protein
MADIIAFESLKKGAAECEVLALFKPKGRRPAGDRRQRAPFEQANAVAMRHYDGDPRVPRAVADKCLELLKALADHAEPE